LDSLEGLLLQARRYPLLSAEQEIELGRQIRQWQDWPDGANNAPRKVARSGKKALDRFVLSNIKLAYSVARRYRDRGVPLSDLTQCALEGLTTASLRFQPELGYRASSYAIWYCKHACQVAMAQQGSPMRLPIYVADALRKLSITEQALLNRNGARPTPAQLGDACGLTAEKVLSLRSVAHTCSVLSLDHTGHQGGSLLDSISAPGGHAEELQRQETRRQLEELLESLPCPQARAVLHLRHLAPEPQTPVRVAGALNLSRRQVFDLEAAALERMRSMLETA
jgi:RNA polymerase sigma factor (sigma-70 family)